jgi:chromosome segregation ATPase
MTQNNLWISKNNWLRRKKHKKSVEKDKKRAFGHLKKHHKKFTRQAKAENTGKVAYAQETQLTEIVEIHEEIIETTEVQIVEFEKRGDTTKVDELKKKLDEHKQFHKDAHKKIKALKKDTHKKKKEITHPKITKIHEVAKSNVRKLKHLEKKKKHHKKAVKKLASNKHLLKRAQQLKDVTMIKYYTEQVTEVTAEVQTITEEVSTVETTIETITSNVETTTVKSATSTLKSELIPAFHAKMSVEKSLRNAHKANQKADEKLAKIKKDPRATKEDIQNAEVDVKEASRRVVESREARQQVFAHLSKTHKKVMAHKADHDIKKHLKNLSKHMQEKAHAEAKLDHHKGVLTKAKKELFKAKKSGDDS